VSIVIPAFGALAGGLFLVSGLMLSLYLPAATHLKKLRMGTAGEPRLLSAELCAKPASLWLMRLSAVE
jgi:hypothetical protein